MERHQGFIYETVKVIRSFEKRTISKKESLGWELVSQTPISMGRTELRFRKEKLKISKKTIIIVGSVVACFAMVLGILAILEKPNESKPSGSSSSDQEIPKAADASKTENNAQEEAGGASKVEVEDAEGGSEILVENTEVGTEIFTIDNNERVAELIANTQECEPLVAQFAEDFRGKTLKFDVAVWAMNKHGNYDTRYDILVLYGDFVEGSTSGPNFQFRNVAPTYDLHYSTEDIPDSIGVGDELTIVAEVVEFEEKSCLFLLEPVETSFR